MKSLVVSGWVVGLFSAFSVLFFSVSFLFHTMVCTSSVAPVITPVSVNVMNDVEQRAQVSTQWGVVDLGWNPVTNQVICWGLPNIPYAVLSSEHFQPEEITLSEALILLGFPTSEFVYTPLNNPYPSTISFVNLLDTPLSTDILVQLEVNPRMEEDEDICVQVA